MTNFFNLKKTLLLILFFLKTSSSFGMMSQEGIDFLIANDQELLNEKIKQTWDNGYTEENIYLYANILIHKNLNDNLKKLLMDFFSKPEHFFNEKLNFIFSSKDEESIDLSIYLPDHLSEVITLESYYNDIVDWKISLKEEHENLKRQWVEIEKKLNNGVATTEDLIYHIGAKLLFVAIAYINNERSINWHADLEHWNFNEDFDKYDQVFLHKNTLLKYAINVLVHPFHTHRRLRDALFRNFSELGLVNLELTDTELAILFPLILIRNKNIEIKTLKINHNQLTIVPKQIGKLKKIEALSIGYNKIKKLPVECVELSNLKLILIKNATGCSYPLHTSLEMEKRDDFKKKLITEVHYIPLVDYYPQFTMADEGIDYSFDV